MEKLPPLLLTKRLAPIALISAACMLILLVISPSIASEKNTPTTIQISITESGFEPRISTITAGSTVIWTNHLETAVYLTSNEVFQIFLPILSNGSSQTSSRRGEGDGEGDTYVIKDKWLAEILLEPGESFSYTFTSKGQYPINTKLKVMASGIIYVNAATSGAQPESITPELTKTPVGDPKSTPTLTPSPTIESTKPPQEQFGKISVSLTTHPADGLDFEFELNDEDFLLDLAIPADGDSVGQIKHFTNLEPGQFTLSLDSLQGYLKNDVICNSNLADPVINIDGKLVQLGVRAGEQISCEYLLFKDSDKDRLADLYETNDGVFNNETATGTDPNQADTDGDGIDDGDEVLGTLDGLDLPSLGSNPLRRTILIEYDWFDDSLENKGHCLNGEDGFHSHRPSIEMINRVKAVYANAPTPNPDGSNGIDLIQDYGQGGLFTGGNLIAKNTTGFISGSVYGSSFRTLKAQNFATNRRNYFHYTIMSHQYGSVTNFSSGNAEVNGDDMIVSVYNYHCSNEIVANTIVHELGHNLGLLHGGDDHLNNKPNYNSVMNYRFQFSGIDSDESCDGWGDGISGYSTGNRISLDENNLNEAHGVCGDNHSGMDWNNDGDMTDAGFSHNINSDSSLSLLHDHNDWENLYFLGILSESTGRLAQRSDVRPVSFATEFVIPDFGHGAQIPAKPNLFSPY